jgi:hypothetical protein
MSYRTYMTLLGAACVAIVASLVAFAGRSPEAPRSHRATGPELVALAAAGAAASVASPPVDEAEPASPPVRIVIPALGVVAPVTRLGLEADGELEVPTDYSRTGWWSGGFEPGQTGPAVIVGHIDSDSGPAVFANLRELQRGDAVQVFRADGRVVEFEVERMEEHDKTQFPTDGVYGETAEPELRLLTCGGEFDESKGHYERNVIVWARARSL